MRAGSCKYLEAEVENVRIETIQRLESRGNAARK